MWVLPRSLLRASVTENSVSCSLVIYFSSGYNSLPTGHSGHTTAQRDRRQLSKLDSKWESSQELWRSLFSMVLFHSTTHSAQVPSARDSDGWSSEDGLTRGLIGTRLRCWGALGAVSRYSWELCVLVCVRFVHDSKDLYALGGGSLFSLLPPLPHPECCRSLSLGEFCSKSWLSLCQLGILRCASVGLQEED